MTKHLSIILVVLGSISNVLCEDQRPDQNKNPRLVPTISSKNIFNAIKDASRSPEYRQAYAQVKDESEKACNILFNQIKKRLNPVEQDYVREVLLAIQDMQIRVTETVIVLKNASEDQRQSLLQSELLKIEQESTRIKERLSRFVNAQEERTPEEMADNEAWAAEVLTMLAQSIQMFTNAGLSEFSK